MPPQRIPLNVVHGYILSLSKYSRQGLPLPNVKLEARNLKLPPRLRLLKRRIKRPPASSKILLFHEPAGLASAEFALHAAVFPFDGQWPLVADAVQLANDLLEVHAATPRA